MDEPLAPPEPLSDHDRRFDGLRRLHGDAAYARLRELHLCVVGVGGVGSWAAEALARSGVGALTLIDWDEVAPGNVNRQVHALTDNFGRRKVAVMAERIAGIHPECRCEPIEDFVTDATLARYLDRGYDAVIDAIDSIRFKADMVYWCRRNKVPVVTTGGAGGRSDPTRVRIADLSRTVADPLAAKVRARLRADYGWTRNPRRTFGVDCVFSDEPPVYPKPDGTVGRTKPGIHGVHLDCRFGYGTTACVTAAFGFAAAARAVARALARRGVTTAAPPADAG